MSTEEAIKYLTRCADGLDPDFDCAVSMAVAALREKQNGGWISVKDRLPKHNRPVLICIEMGWGQIIGIGRWISNAGNTPWRTDSGDIIMHDVTHWQPLPEPLKKEEET